LSAGQRGERGDHPTAPRLGERGAQEAGRVGVPAVELVIHGHNGNVRAASQCDRLERLDSAGFDLQHVHRLARRLASCDTGLVATFCLIHGNWHDGSCWAPLAERLRSRGHEVLAPDMPFDDAAATYEERARPAVAALADVEGPIVVVGHSVGSAEAALVAAERKVARLVYLCPRFGSFATPSGAPAVFREGFPFPAKDAEGRMVWEPDAAVAAMYPRLPSETARRLASRLRP
jgi:pimeloyl-ACP methyl ester carboxylesterase